MKNDLINIKGQLQTKVLESLSKRNEICENHDPELQNANKVSISYYMI